MAQGILGAARCPREEAQMAEGGSGGGGVGVTGGARGWRCWGDGMDTRGWDGWETMAVQEGPAGGSSKPTFDIFKVPF